MPSNWNRRDLMKLFGVGAASSLMQSPVELLVNSMIDGLVTEAVASETGKRARNYVFIQQTGAPSRWMYDLFINPNNDSKFKPSMAVGSEFKQRGSVYDGVIYQGHLLKGGKFWGPRIWTQQVAKAGGGQRRIDDLMDNMLVLQGVNTGNSGHSGAMELLNNPFTPVSLGGAVADNSNTPITSLSMDTRNQNYKSLLGKNNKTLNTGGRALETLMSPFSKKVSEEMLSVESSVSNRIMASVSKMNKYNNVRLSGSKSVSIDQNNALDLMASSIDDLGTKWNALVAKYEDVIGRTIDMSSRGLAGFSDRPIGLSNLSNRNQLIYKNGDNNITNADLRSAITGARLYGMAAKFAVTEYVLINRLSSFVGLGLGGISKLNFEYDGVGARDRGYSVGNDQHGVGAMTSLLSNTLMYRSISACILTLIDSLKASPGFMGDNLFDDTVIRLAGEFGRSPKSDGSGSDHAARSTTNSIYSGNIKGLTITGNVTVDPIGYNANNYQGTWGTAAKASVLGGREVNPGNVVSTMSSLLGFKPISVNNPALVSVIDDKVYSVLGDSELVDE